jgi:hypothetical protein
MNTFCFELGQRVRVSTHSAGPLGIIVERWTGAAMQDVHGENISSVNSFVTKQRK